MQVKETEGFLFDIYNIEEDVHIWILDKEGKPHLFLDHYFPIIYLDGKEADVRKIIKRLEEYKALKEVPNISPETVLCECCIQETEIERVPTANYHICKKRRGVVSLALEHILNRRTYYKKRKKETQGTE